MKATYITVYLYSNNIVTTDDMADQTPNVKCIHCGRHLGRARGRIFTLANTRMPDIQEIPVGVAAFEVKCPTCSTIHKLVWQ